MKFPIDMIWLDENYNVVTIASNVSPNTFPKTFRPSVPSRYVLEVNAGFAQKNKLSTSSQLIIKR
jgi:uncharacterized membrane protein (UPF0127 family)